MRSLIKRIVLHIALFTACLVLLQVKVNAEEVMDSAKEGVVQVNLIYKDDENKTHIIEGGTGFLIGDEEENVEYVITCKHIIAPERDYIKKALKEFGVKKDELENKVDSVEYEVVVAKDVCTSASLYLSSDDLDMAVLQLSERLSNRTMMTLFTSESGTVTDLPYKSTDTVYSLGFPAKIDYVENPAYYGNDQAVMSSGRIMNMHSINDTYTITHDIAVAENNCGGPLLNENGYVIGMNVLTKDGDYYVSVDGTEMIEIFDSFGMKYSKVTPKDIKKEEPKEKEEIVKEKIVVEKTDNHLLIIVVIVFAVVLVVLIIIVTILMIRQKRQNKEPKPKKKKNKKEELKKPFESKAISTENSGKLSGVGLETSVLGGTGNDETSVLETNTSIGGAVSRGKLIRKKTGDNIDITKERTVIGKDSLHTDYCIRDNSAISRMHTVIIANKKSVYIEDAHSTNGTFINGRRLGDGEQVELRGGENIRLGNEEFIFRK